ncbi:DUF4437 domain-containing protein [Photobacterium carnosum]|uniref:DUF4437 domain-containing protein n=1 Tax=Photobacterium carnosum TaxID=2023717 RepID=UPI001E418E43|nr:DUF4437 domain-containing protein [Photobacterium carnosum]MCD9497291.1 DUF4437 domain-containing protein [Photobacterium carnosum]
MKKLISLAILLTFSGTVYSQDNIVSKTLTDKDKKFVTVMDPIQFADAYGDAKSGNYGRFGLFPAHFETPSHIHSHGYNAVVIKGTMINPFDHDKNPPILTPGSFWSVKAGDVHTTACISDTPCEFFVYSNKSFDFDVKK